VGPQLTDKCPQFGQQVIKVSETWKRIEKPKLQVQAPPGHYFSFPWKNKHLNLLVNIQCVREAAIRKSTMILTATI
jgi:hypothetical protein